MRKFKVGLVWVMIAMSILNVFSADVKPLVLMSAIPLYYWCKVWLEDYHSLYIEKAFTITFLVYLVSGLITGIPMWLTAINVLMLVVCCLDTYKELEKSKRRIYFRSS